MPFVRSLGANILAEQVIENAVRVDLRPVESGRAYKRIMEVRGWTALQVADELGIEPNSVYRALALVKLPEPVQAAVDSGAIRPTAAYEISKLQNADEQIRLAAQVVQEGLDHAATAAAVRSRKGTRKSKRRAPKEQHHRGPRGVRVIVRAAAKHTLDDIAADLLEIAARIRAELNSAAA